MSFKSSTTTSLSLSLSLSLFLFGFILFSENSAQARTFKNAYISFEMLDSWKCKLEQTEFVCRSEEPNESKEAVIIFTAKEKGPTDSFPIYFEHLNKQISAPAKTGTPLISTVTIPPREVLINDQKWLDSLHINSEVQNYYTRYLATIKDQISVLITFTAHNSKYQKHAAHFAETVKSLRVIASKDLNSSTNGGAIGGAGGVGVFGGVNNAMNPNDLIADELPNSGSQSAGGLLSNELFLGFILLLLAGGAYVGIRMYKKNNG